MSTKWHFIFLCGDNLSFVAAKFHTLTGSIKTKTVVLSVRLFNQYTLHLFSILNLYNSK